MHCHVPFTSAWHAAQVHMTGSVALTCPAILAAVAAVALKSLLESIRLEVRAPAALGVAGAWEARLAALGRWMLAQ